MLGRQSIKITYAHKKRRSRNVTRMLPSSPLAVLPMDMDDITRSQMARRMLKRSRRVALAEHLAQDKNMEHLREHVAMRIRQSEEHVSNLETPFPSPRPAHESEAVAKPPAPDKLSPVPRAKDRTTSQKLKENDHKSSRTLSSPFSSRPGSATSSPKHKGRARLSRRVLRHMRPKLKHRHQNQPSDTSFHTPDDYETFTSPGGLVHPETSFYTAHSSAFPRASVHSHESFYTAQPQSASTPAIPRLRKALGHTSAGLFITEYEIPLHDIAASSVPKVSVGDLNFPGTSPAHGGALFFRTCKRSGALTPPAKPSPPLSPASDLVQELGSMDICADLGTQSDGETRHSSPIQPLLTRAHSLQDGLANANPVLKKRMPARNRAGTIRASDFIKPGLSLSFSNVRRTRSGTVVGPDSKLVAKGAGTKATAVQSGSESESDDELLLKTAWIEDMVYLGLSVPVRDASEADELNLSGPWSRRC